jgi:hypothetical protein
MTKHRRPTIPDNERPYKVGYRKPDPKYAFTKNNRANPDGRPPMHKTNSQIVTQLFAETIEYEVNGKTKKMAWRDLALRKIRAKAGNGDIKAFEFLLRLQNDHGTDLSLQELEPAERRILESELKRASNDPEAFRALLRSIFGEPDE